MHTTEYDGAVTSISITQDGMQLLAATDNVSLQATGLCVCVGGDSSACVTMSYYAMCSPFQGSIGILNASNKKSQILMRSHSQPIVCMGLSPRGGHLATCSKDGTVRIWELDTGGQVGVTSGCGLFTH